MLKKYIYPKNRNNAMKEKRPKKKKKKRDFRFPHLCKRNTVQRTCMEH